MCDESNKEKCMKKWVLGLLAATFITSLTTMILMVVSMVGANGINIGGQEANHPVVISKQLDKGQSFEKALAKNKPIIAWFYVDWCGYCQKFAPVFKDISKDRKIKKNFAIAFINAEHPDSKKYMEEYGVQGFPTVYVINPKTGEKMLVDNNKLFAPGAKSTLVSEFLDFIRVK